jgi:hypothetical protein
MKENFNIDDFDLTDGDNEDLNDDESNSSGDDNYYNYSGRDPNEIYDDLKDIPQEELSKRLDVDSLLKYNNELRKQNEFQREYGLEDSDAIEYQNKMKENFRDYLILRNITGRQKGLFYHNIIPVDRISDSGKSVEVFDDRRIKDKIDKQKSTVIVHKTNSDDVDLIEVLCSCGKRTYIKLDYEAVDSTVIYSEGEHYPTFDDDIQTYEEPENNDGFVDITEGATVPDIPTIEEFDFGDDGSGGIAEDYNFEDFSSK